MQLASPVAHFPLSLRCYFRWVGALFAALPPLVALDAKHVRQLAHLAARWRSQLLEGGQLDGGEALAYVRALPDRVKGKMAAYSNKVRCSSGPVRRADPLLGTLTPLGLSAGLLGIIPPPLIPPPLIPPPIPPPIPTRRRRQRACCVTSRHPSPLPPFILTPAGGSGPAA